jgi:hypothetical protein
MRKLWFILLILLVGGCSGEEASSPEQVLDLGAWPNQSTGADANQEGDRSSRTDAGRQSDSSTGDAFVNPGDLDCLQMTPLRLWTSEPSAVSLLYRVHTCAGEPVQLREVDDYVIRDDGSTLSSETVPNLLAVERTRVYISLLLDMSDSTKNIRGEILTAAKQFVTTVNTTANLDIWIGVRTFDGREGLQDWQLPITDVAALHARLDALESHVDPFADGGATNLFGGLASGVEDLRTWQERVIERNRGWAASSGYAVVFTDGRDTAGRIDLNTAAERVAAARTWDGTTQSRPNVESYGIALKGDDFDDAARADLVSLLGSESYFVEADQSNLADVFETMAQRIVSQVSATHLLTYCSSKRAGQHTVSIDVDESVGRADMALEFLYDAEGFTPGCGAYVESVCESAECGGFNCGACRDDMEVCGDNLHCIHECALALDCDSASIVNALGYPVDCSQSPAEYCEMNQCVDTSRNRAHCGACDNQCAGDLACFSGVCEPCPGGKGVCGDTCVDLQSDVTHCGECGVDCTQGEVCQIGECICVDPMGCCSWASDASSCDPVVEVAAGYENTCARSASGKVHCWGSNQRDLLGESFTGDQSLVPVFVRDGSAEISVGVENACSVDAAGAASCWGPSWSQYIPGSTSSVRVVDTGDVTCVIRTNRACDCWVQGRWYPIASGNVVSGDVGYGVYGCFIDTQGRVACVNNFALDFQNPITDTATSVAAGEAFGCAIRADKSLVCWGRNDLGQAGAAPVASISATSVAGIADALQVVAGRSHACALTEAGQVYCWGANGRGQLGRGTTAGGHVPVRVQGLAGIVGLEAGNEHTCAIRSTGGLYCWGANDVGQLGNGQTQDSSVPAHVEIPR